MPAGFPSVIPAGPPLSFPPVSPITNVGDKVSGNPGACFVVVFVVPLFVWACMGEDLDSRLKMSGMTEGGIVGNDRRGIEGVGHNGRGIDHMGHDGRPALPLCHARWFPR